VRRSRGRFPVELYGLAAPAQFLIRLADQALNERIVTRVLPEFVDSDFLISPHHWASVNRGRPYPSAPLEATR
jgi:hypothetical protein